MRLGWILPSKDFVRHINKVCSNRKKYVRTKKEINGLNSTAATTSSQIEPPPPSTNGHVFNDQQEQETLQFQNDSYCPLEITDTFSQAQT